MADERFSDELRRALAWAQAIEAGDDVGTRAILIGMMRAAEGVSQPDQLLRVVGVPPEALFAELQEVVPGWRIDPRAPAPDDGERPPLLTANAERALQLASDRRREDERDAPLETCHVFDALLEMPNSTAYQGLARALRGRASMEQIAAIHHEHLARLDGRSFEEVLRERLTIGRGGGPNLQLPQSGITRALAFAPSGETLAIGHPVSGVLLWDLGSAAARPATEASRPPTALAFGPDGRRLAIIADDLVALWSVSPGESPRLFQLFASHEEPVTDVAFFPDGSRFAASSRGTAVVWTPGDPASRAIVVSDSDLLALACPSNDQVVAFDEGGSVMTLDLTTGEARRTSAIRPDGPLVAAFSSNGRWLAFAPRDGGAINVLDLTEGGTVAFHRGEGLTALALSADGRRLAVADDAGNVHVHDIAGDVPLEDRVEWLSDARARQDLLGREHLAAALAKRLDRMTKAVPHESFLIHLDGPWGAGKSSVLYFLRQRLEERWLIVAFDAWRQSRVGPPWWALLTSLRKALRCELGSRGGSWLRLREVFARLWRDHAVLPFGALLLAAAGAYVLIAPTPTQVKAAVAAVSAVVAGFALLLGLGRGAVAFLLWDSAIGARCYEQWHKDPMEGLADHFTWLLRRSPRRVVFFVDDLDRCDEAYVVNLLDAIQTLVRDAGEGRAPCFVVAADGRWIRCSYECRHEHFKYAVGEPGRPLGYLFLDKIFQLTVDVPAIGGDQQSSFLRQVLGRAAHTDGADAAAATARLAHSTTQREILAAVQDASPEQRPEIAAAAIEKLSEPDTERATEHELLRFAPLLERNPRSMKRFVNAYSMALSTMLLEERDVDPDTLALWTIVRLRWPDLATRLSEQPDQLGAFTGDQAPPGDGDPLAELAGFAPLRAIAAFDGRRLTSDAIRRLTGP